MRYEIRFFVCASRLYNLLLHFPVCVCVCVCWKAVAGERFAECRSDTDGSTRAPVEDDGFTLSSVSTSLAATDVMSTPIRNRAVRGGAASDVPKSTVKPDSESVVPTEFEHWERTEPSRTGTCVGATVGNYFKRVSRSNTAQVPNQSSSPTKASRNSAKLASTDLVSAVRRPIAPLILTWKGSDPLDRLHICLRVCTPTFSFNSNNKSTPANLKRTSSHRGEGLHSRSASGDFSMQCDTDVIVGKLCVIVYFAKKLCVVSVSE